MILFLFISIIILFFVWKKKHFNYWADRGFYQADASFPLGSLSGVGTKMCSTEKYDMIYRKFKGKTAVVGFYNFLSPAILPIDTELIKNILVREFSSFHDRGLYYNKEDDPVSASMLTLEGQEWKDRRTKFTSIFTSGKMKMMFEIVDSIGDKLANAVSESLNQSNEQDMRIWAQKYTNDTIGNVAFGLEFNSLDDPNSEFLKNGKRLFELKPLEVLKILFASEKPELARKLKLKFTPEKVGDFFLNTFLETFEYRERNNVVRNDFVQLLLGLKDTYTPSELAAEAFLVYTGGFETSSSLMSFVLYELSQNLDIQQRLRDEITTGIETNDGKLTYDLLHSFKYLDMVINETLRKFPPLPNVFRKCTKNYQIPDTDLIISKGSSIVINSFSLHRDAEYFPNPEKFDPERFNDENAKNINQFAFLPFGGGNRNCIGLRFGLMQSKIGIAKLITNFIFSPSDKTPIPMKFIPSSPFITPVGGMILNVEKIAK